MIKTDFLRRARQLVSPPGYLLASHSVWVKLTKKAFVLTKTTKTRWVHKLLSRLVFLESFQHVCLGHNFNKFDLALHVLSQELSVNSYWLPVRGETNVITYKIVITRCYVLKKCKLRVERFFVGGEQQLMTLEVLSADRGNDLLESPPPEQPVCE